MHDARARPWLVPALGLLWRDAGTAQFGTGPGRARVLSGLPAGSAALLELLDGTRTQADLVGKGSALGLDSAAVHDVLHALRRAGVLLDADPAKDLPRELGPSARRRLAAELSALALAGDETPGRTISRRRAQQVIVRGGGRLDVPIATILATSGVGRVHVEASGTVSDNDVSAAGPRVADAFRPRATAAAEAVQAVAPEVDTRAPRNGTHPDLIIVTGPAQPAILESLTPRARRVAHLMVGVRDGVAVVGPLIVPGRTACLHCIHLHRLDRDPSWPALDAQLRTGPKDRPQACGAALTAAAASLCVMQALCHLDGGTAESLSASLELRPPGFEIRRRSWDLHPRCGCTARKVRAG